MQSYMELRARSMAWNTYRQDYYRLSSLDRFLCFKSFVQEVVTQDLIGEWLQTNYVPQASIEGYLKTLRGFMQYRIQLGKPAYLPPYRKNLDSYIPYIFSDEELKNIMSCADRLERDRPGLFAPFIYSQVPMIIRILYCCGLRLDEALCLKIKYINFENGILTIPKAKRDKQRFVPMHKSLSDMLYNYCAIIGIVSISDAFIFPGIGSDKHLSATTIERHFKFILKHLEIITGKENIHERGPCLHCLRHCFILSSFRRLTKGGYPVDISFPYLSIYCGHESLAATEKYMKFSSEMFDDEMNLFTNFLNPLFPEANL